MLLRTIKSSGLAHLSYLVGSGGRAAVIDPRLDSDIYDEIAGEEGLDITMIFETHRNEDYVIGSRDLAARCGAEIYHGSRMDFGYGTPVAENDTFDMGGLRLSVLETPGHTLESISIALFDRSFSDNDPVAVFTGDALFVGEVGRTDFYPGRDAEVAGLLYDSIFENLLPLGDGVVILPGHGSGSICGGKLASREFSTLGYEREHNPRLQNRDRDEFIEMKVREHHYLPPYFETVHRVNREGPPILELSSGPRLLDADDFEERAAGGFLLDARSPEAFAGAHVPGSLSIPLDMIPKFAGWFLPYDSDLLIVAEDVSKVDSASRYLSRMGYLGSCSYLRGGLLEWYSSGRKYGHVVTIHVEELVEWIVETKDFFLLDVRTIAEYESEHLPGAVNIYLGHLPESLEEVPGDIPVVTFCGTGKRSIIAASILLSNGFENVLICFGSMSACRSMGCPVVRP